MSQLSNVVDIVKAAQAQFREVLETVEKTGGMTRERYVRFLSMQHHLTNGVQRHFYTCASHSSMAHKKGLRKFLVNFANEEEPHFQIAARDLESLDAKPLPACLDVKLWWAFFDQMVVTRPFVRLGATCILENISAGNGDIIRRLMGAAGFLTPRNTRFLVIHQHEDLPHGDQILEALTTAEPDANQVADLIEGARHATTLYLRLFGWAMEGRDVGGLTAA